MRSHRNTPAASVGALCLTLCLAATTHSPLRAQCLGEEAQKLVASDGSTNDYAGWSVSVSGDFALVSAHYDDDLGAESGSAYVWNFDGSQWLPMQKLVASDGAAGDQFGGSLAIDGSVAVVGAINADGIGPDTGAAYVFRFDGTKWQEEQKLMASDGIAGDAFGYSVSLRDDVAVVSALWDDGAGAAYVYRFDGSQWVEEQKLISRDRFARDFFGWSVSHDGSNILVSAALDDDAGLDSGSAYVFRFDGTAWSESQKILASDGSSFDVFGNSVSISGSVAIIGPQNENAAYVFRFDGTRWVEEQKITGSVNSFGNTVIIRGSEAVVGSLGGAWVYRFDGTRWIEERALVASDGVNGDGFGRALSNTSDWILVAAPNDDDMGSNSGSAYLFPRARLALDAGRDTVRAGDSLTLKTCGGLQGMGNLLTIVGVNGSNVFLMLELGTFDSSGEHTFGATVPPGLSGNTVDFLSLGIYQPGRIGLSNFERISFQ